MKRKLTAEEQKMYDAYRKHQAYMKAYNKRPMVRAKRKIYNSERWEAIKAAKNLVKEHEAIEIEGEESN
jgi:hypothetical protein